MNRNIHYIYNIALLLLMGAATPAFAQTIKGNVYGGGNLSQVVGSTTINIKSGNINSETADDGNVYGGGYGASAVLTGNTTINVTGGTITKDVYGGGALANVTGSTEVNIAGGTVTQDVYGGGALANVVKDLEHELLGNTTVNLTGGTIRHSYGGGLGQLADAGSGKEAVEAIVNGDATVTLGKLQDKADPSDPDVYTASKVLGSIFGANNINGTPEGHVKVHVLKTTPREGQTSGQYDVAAVYGGGNLAAYIPSDATLADNDKNFAEVLIENCDNSIEYVYGGGNAAPVPATKVTIKGANAIDNAFAGGNGAGADNPGADIGYKGFFSSGAATEYGTGIATINVQGGTIHHVYGGSNTLGYIKDHAEVNVNAAGTCTMDVAELYGGGKMAPGKAAIINIACTGEGKIDNVYGGAHMADLTGDITLNINGGNIGNAFGGNNESGTIDGAITVNVDWDEDACGENSLTNVYGGGNLAPYTTPDGKEGPTVNLINGTVSNNVYGGGYGEAAIVTGNPIVNLIGGAVTNDIFGGGDAAPVTGDPLVNANYGSVNDIFAGGRGSSAVVTGDPKAYVNKTDDKELTVVDVYGGGDAADVDGTGKVQLDNGTVTNIYGGGNAADVTNTDVVINGGEAAMAFAGGHGNKDAVDGEGNPAPTEANVSGDAHLTIHGGTVAKAFAGSNSKGTITGDQILTIVKTDDALAELHVTEVYGGGNQADGKAGTIIIGCTGEEATEGVGDVYGGAREANITTDISLNIQGGNINRVFGGNNISGDVTGSINVDINEDIEQYTCGLYINNVYGAGNLANYTTPAGKTDPTVNIKKGTINYDVFGGGLQAKVTGNTIVNVTGGTVSRDVYGGGALADVTDNTTVNLTGGAVGGAYGGGLGQLASDAVGIEGQPGYQPAKEAVEAIVGGTTTVTLNGSQVTGEGIFGANNVNGTPKGHVFVHVLSTTKRLKKGSTTEYEEYDVPAVYGGGNKAAYEPTNNDDYAEVLIENCDNSIEYVYGGGNAAPVPATSVTIYGADAIDNAFAGGNGYGAGNPGADVGYKGFYSKGSHEEYGTGIARINVYGGTVNNVYGGSNTLGYIRTHTYVTVDEVPDNYTGIPCELKVGNVHGGGNEAEMLCGGTVTLGCTEGANVVYAGANNAHIHGDIDLTISSGTYGKVFGGNNIGGNVYGAIRINIDETGCYPVMIGELYGAGCEAPYSVYGYEEDGVKAPKTSGDKLYGNGPEINIVSCTRIAKIFGGGWGETATVYGSPTININTIKGIYAGKKPTPFFVLNSEEDGRVENSEEIDIPDLVGLIGTIYGGGNAASVYGDTNINIGTELTGSHVSGSDVLKADVQGVNVRIEGNVYGGSKGKLGNPYAAKVTGSTFVNVGKE